MCCQNQKQTKCVQTLGTELTLKKIDQYLCLFHIYLCQLALLGITTTKCGFQFGLKGLNKLKYFLSMTIFASTQRCGELLSCMSSLSFSYLSLCRGVLGKQGYQCQGNVSFSSSENNIFFALENELKPLISKSYVYLCMYILYVYLIKTVVVNQECCRWVATQTF